MTAGIYVGVLILAFIAGLFLGERYGKREVDSLKAQLASARKAVEYALDNANKKLKEEIKTVATDASTVITGTASNVVNKV